jgi:type IV pilus biogenesis protein CpaD/CtpE
MKSVRFSSRRLPHLSLVMVGLAFLLASCANSNQKPATVGSAFPYDYNADARGFEGTWPYGRGGYH